MKAEKHQTLYRTYRPTDWSEVKGQPQVTDVLEKAIKNKKIGHAYLFAGGRGTGKTTTARILAKSLGVSDKDLYEMDAASNRGIDDIRELREGVYARPFEGEYKFYIIDEAHMLTKEAWNAFLKTLEEPPAHAIFVLATTDRDKVPETIQSRCEIYTFKQPTREILSQIVTDVAKKEGFTLERSAAELVALLAEGSFRDALREGTSSPRKTAGARAFPAVALRAHPPTRAIPPFPPKRRKPFPRTPTTSRAC